MTITYASARLTIGGVEYAIVPVEPTVEMVRAGWDVEELVTPSKTWDAMTAAAPALHPDAERALRVAFGEGNEVRRAVELTDEQCDQFRRHPGSFNDMVRAIYAAGSAASHLRQEKAK
jgi:hypothetical protein